jgi:predicted nicotinamide N-methyase
MMASTTKLPSSPAARAFFEALDAQGDKRDNSKQSSFVQNRIQQLGWRNRYSQDECYPVTVKDTEFSVLQVQRGELDGTYGTGATVWPASMVLIKYLELHADDLMRNKRIADLGAGTAVCSIAAALLGASHVLCTDGDSNVVKLARDNVARACKQVGGTRDEHDCGCTIIDDCPLTVEQYWWGEDPIQTDGVDVDIILVSDCVLPKLYPIAPLVEALDQMLVKQDASALLSYEHRHFAEYHPKQKFCELCAAKDLVVETIPVEEYDPVYSVEDIEIWRVTRRQ